jgi:hypothetical protein
MSLADDLYDAQRASLLELLKQLSCRHAFR